MSIDITANAPAGIDLRTKSASLDLGNWSPISFHGLPPCLSRYRILRGLLTPHQSIRGPGAIAQLCRGRR